MKYLLIIFSLLLTSVSWSKDVDYTDLVTRDGLWYEKITDKPFTGNVIGDIQGKIINGKEEGKWLFYYVNGQLWMKTNYKDGKREGEELEYYENGKLKKTYIWKDGKLIE